MEDKHEMIIQSKKSKEEIKSKKLNDLEFIKLKVNENKEKKINLIKEQKELINKLPPHTILKNSNKNLPQNEIQRLKFEPPQLDKNNIVKALDKDLLDYEKNVDNIMFNKKPKINLILEKLKSIISDAFPNYEIKIFGAFAQGLCLPWSDLKLILVNKNCQDNDIENNNTDIESTIGEMTVKSSIETDNNTLVNDEKLSINNKDINKLLNALNLVLNQNNLPSQIIKNYLFLSTNEEYDKIKIYISFYTPEHQGLKVLDLVKSYMKEYPPMRPLIFALGTILKSAHLNKANSGGLSSYGLILMVVSFIQNFIQNQKDNINNLLDIEYINGKLFYEFLNYYGFNFDCNKYLIITYLKNEINSPLNGKENQFNFGPNPNVKELTIVDPLNKNNNVGKSTYQFLNIKIAFIIAFMVTKEKCECGCHFGRSIYEYDYNSIDHCYLKRIFNSVRRFQEQ